MRDCASRHAQFNKETDPMSDKNLAEAVITSARKTLTDGLHKIEHCVGQLTDEQVWSRPPECKDPEMNSIANLLLHLSGNIRQWLVAGVGGAKDIRNRPLEFSDRSNRPKSEVLLQLQSTIKEADAALATTLSPGERGQGEGKPDKESGIRSQESGTKTPASPAHPFTPSPAHPTPLTAARRIQGYDTNVIAAIFKCITHFHGHVQEIIHMTRRLLGDRYRFDFVPKGPEQTSASSENR
jgi:hypothetical protein